MKKTLIMSISGIITLMSFNSFAEENISGAKMAALLSSTKVAPCLAKLYKLESTYDLHPNVYAFKVLEDKSNQMIHTTISYTVIEGGDMAVGSANIIVTEKLSSVFGAPKHVKVPRVVGCKYVTKK